MYVMATAYHKGPKLGLDQNFRLAASFDGKWYWYKDSEQVRGF